jgi:hypothetical protein
LEKLQVPALDKAVEKFAWAQSCADLAGIACALERYRLAHGSYPVSIDALPSLAGVPIPNDLLTGKPLKYHRTGDRRFELYSVGWNQSDDGGRVVLKQSGTVDPERGDWVWPSAPEP